MTRVARVTSPATSGSSRTSSSCRPGGPSRRRFTYQRHGHSAGGAAYLARLSDADEGLMTALGALPVLLVGLLASISVDRLPRLPLLIVADVGRAALLFAIPVASRWGSSRFAGFRRRRRDRRPQRARRCRLPSAPTRHCWPGAARRGQQHAQVRAIRWRRSLAHGWPVCSYRRSARPSRCSWTPSRFSSRADGLALIRQRFLVEVGSAQRENVLREALAGMRLIVRDPVLRALAGCMGTFNFFGYFIGTLYVLFAIRDLRLSPAAAVCSSGWVRSLAGRLARRHTRRPALRAGPHTRGNVP